LTRYLPSRNYLHLGILAVVLGALSLWIAISWLPAGVAAVLFLATAAVNFFLFTRDAIELGPDSLILGDREYLWSEVARIEKTGWISPLVVWIHLKDGRRELLIYPGALDGSRRLSEELSRCLTRSRESAALRAVSTAAGAAKCRRAPLLNAADEAEVERLFQRLKTVGHLESSEDK